MGAHASRPAPASFPEDVTREPLSAEDVIRRVTCIDERLGVDGPDGVDEAPAPWTTHKVLRAVRHVEATAEQVAAVLADLARGPEYDLDLKEAVAVKPPAGGPTPPLGTTPVHFVLKPIAHGVISARDFSTVHATANDVARSPTAGIGGLAADNLLPFAFVSAFADGGDKLIPTQGGLVRGTCHSYGFTVRRATPSPRGTLRVRIACVMCFDLGGWIPDSAADKGGPAMQHLLDRLTGIVSAAGAPPTVNQEQ